MRVSVDDISALAKDINQVKKIIREYEATIMAEKRVVSHYLVDGIEVADIDAYLEGVDIHEIQNIILVSRTPQELVRESVITFLDYLPALRKGLFAVKEKLTTGDDIPEGSWLPLIEGLDWTNQLLHNLKCLINIEVERLKDIATRWKEQLGEMLSAWESGDTIFLADILEYEVLDILEELESYFQMYLSQGEEH